MLLLSPLWEEEKTPFSQRFLGQGGGREAGVEGNEFSKPRFRMDATFRWLLRHPPDGKFIMLACAHVTIILDTTIQELTCGQVTINLDPTIQDSVGAYHHSNVSAS